MMGHIVVIKPLIAFVAEVGLAEESSEGIAPIVVFTLFDETNDLVRRGGSSVDDHVRWVNRHDLDLVPGQGGLKLFEFRETTGSFGTSRKLVKFLGLSFLDRTALFEIVIILVLGISVSVYQSFHRDDGPSTTQIIFILDGDA